MRGNKLTTTEEERNVGVIFTSNLKPSTQCSRAAGCATSVLNQLKRNFHYRDRHIFVNLYKQYVRPHLEFSSQAWSPWLAGDIEVIKKVQEKAVKMVSGLKGNTYEEKCTELGLATPNSRRDRQDMALVHKYVRSDRQDLFTLASNNGGARTRRAAGEKCLVTQFARTDIRKNSFAVRIVDNWNQLPEKVRAEEKLPPFKRKLKGLVPVA
jgi:ribonucleases P/MRP protein subunit RPP40